MWTHEIEAWARAARGAGRRDSTIRLRTYYLHLFADESTTEPYDTSADDISAWLAYPHWKPETRKSARSSLRVFYRWAVKTGRTSFDPAAVTDSIRVPAGHPRPAPESVLAAALDRAAPQVQLMLLLAAYDGLRRAEIAALHARDLVEGWVWVHGKGGKTRDVPLHALVRAHLEEHPPGDGYLFPAPAGGHLTADRVGRLMSAALGPGWTAHTLRHRFATRLYAGSHDVLQTQELLGHASPKTTQRYVRLPSEQMVAAVNAIA